MLDTSAISAVIFGEPEAEAFLAAMTRHAGELVMSAATAVEVGIVVEAKQGPEATRDLHDLLAALRVAIRPMDEEQARIAVAAWRRFGRGRHPAGLNFGDCCTYALAKADGAALLFKGNDFSQTDVISAW